MNLLRLCLRYGSGLLILLMIVVTLIHAQPFDDYGLHALIFPDRCPSACFMGIQPGITTAAQAHDRLEESGFVSQWIEPTDTAASGLVHWQWNSNRPALLTGTDARLTYDPKTGLVIAVDPIETRLTFGMVLLMLGQPDMGFMSGGFNDRGGSIFTHAVGYSNLRLSMVSTLQCPMTIRQLWDTTVTLQIAPTADQTARFTPYPARIQPLLAYAAYAFC